MVSKLDTIACENKSESMAAAVLLSPFRTLLGNSRDSTVWVYCWAFLIGLYLLLYYVVPNTFLNTYQGFKSGWMSVLWSLAIFFLCIATLILWTRRSACAKTKLEGGAPTWLLDAANSVLNK
jgi:hypothetical protein